MDYTEEDLIKIILSMDARLQRMEEMIIDIKQTATSNEATVKKITTEQRNISAALLDIHTRMDEEYNLRHPVKNIIFKEDNNENN